jgi:hypothetical protein
VPFARLARFCYVFLALRNGAASSRFAVRKGEDELSLMDGDPGPPPSKLPRYIVLGGAVLAVIAIAAFFTLRFHTEKATVRLFLSQDAAGDFQAAYHTWKPGSSYGFEDFLRDWGPKGEYGPVKSFELREAHRPPDASGVVVTVDLSPYSPFPEPSDPKSRDTKGVRLWVESSDQSISYAPTEYHIKR